MRLLVLFSVLLIACTRPDSVEQKSLREQPYVAPVFADSAAFEKLKDFFPLVDSIYKAYAHEHHFPAITYGVVVGNKLIHVGQAGMANTTTQAPASSKTLFRIASMSKSFTAMAILKLRDEGKLSLSDPVSKYIPEFSKAGSLTSDAPVITIQHLLTMSAGFPEDNPWGDRQLDDTDQELLNLVGGGLSLSNVPGVSFEYSNLGYGLLGKVVTNVSGIPFQKYITENILKPIGMNDSRWEYDDVPKEQLALGYQWEDEKWKEIPMLHDGAYGSMGGLICSIEDFAKYISLHLNAWPPRNGDESGPVNRSSIREMHQPWRMINLYADAKNRKGESCPIVQGYGYGLGWRKDCRGVVRVSHSGGLPGFGSEWRIYPEYGIGVVSFSNHTYGAPGQPNAIVLDTLVALAGLKPRVLSPSSILNKRKEEIVKLLPDWNGDTTIFAENFFADEALGKRRESTQKLFTEMGAIRKINELIPENQLRGSFIVEGEKKNMRVFLTLTPERNALVQQLDLNLEDKLIP